MKFLFYLVGKAVPKPIFRCVDIPNGGEGGTRFPGYCMSTKGMRSIGTASVLTGMRIGVDIATGARMKSNLLTPFGDLKGKMEVVELDAEELDEFAKVSQPAVLDWLCKEVGAEHVDAILEEVNNIRNQVETEAGSVDSINSILPTKFCAFMA